MMLIIFMKQNRFLRIQLKQFYLREYSGKKTFVGTIFPSKFSFDEILVHFLKCFAKKNISLSLKILIKRAIITR